MENRWCRRLIQKTKEAENSPIDFVLCFSKQGSIIALAKLMDALEYGEDATEGFDDAEQADSATANVK
jgi:hypothetical protein